MTRCAAYLVLLACAACSPAKPQVPCVVIAKVPRQAAAPAPKVKAVPAPKPHPTVEALLWQRTLREGDDASWQLTLELVVRPPPADGHLPLRLEFVPTTYFERALVDGDRIIERRIPMHDRQPFIEVVDVAFVAPGDGKPPSRVALPLRLSRTRGYEAGKYRLRIATQAGETVFETTLELRGENPVVDRRPGAFGP